MKILTPKEKLALYRELEQNPALGLLKAVEMVRVEMRGMIKDEMASMKKQLTSDVVIDAVDALKGIRGEDGEDADPEEVATVILETPGFLEMAKGDKGDSIKGDKGDGYILTEKDKEEIALNVKVPIVDKVIERTETIIEKPIITEVIKEKAIDSDALEIASKLNTLEEKINLNVINGLNTILQNLREAIRRKTGKQIKGGGGGDLVQTYDLSSQTNGVLKTFTVPYFRTARYVFMSDGPALFLGLGNGFTVNAAHTQITLTVTNAPSTGSQLFFDYII